MRSLEGLDYFQSCFLKMSKIYFLVFSGKKKISFNWRLTLKNHPLTFELGRTYSDLVMSPSWNFPARAEASYEGSEPSRAGALQFPS